jgi:hypothetical protein
VFSGNFDGKTIELHGFIVRALSSGPEVLSSASIRLPSVRMLRFRVHKFDQCFMEAA